MKHKPATKAKDHVMRIGLSRVLRRVNEAIGVEYAGALVDVRVICHEPLQVNIEPSEVQAASLTRCSG